MSLPMLRPYGASDIEPAHGGKVCPNCRKVFHRRKGEDRRDFDRRITCGVESCRRKVQEETKRNKNAKGEVVSSWVSADEITCANCRFWDDEEKCAPCTGQNFRRK